MTCTERFLKYVAVYTTSDEESEASPSTQRQLDLSRLLEKEMNELSLANVHIDSCGNVIGTLPATKGVKAPALALVAHVDTSPAAPGENIKASIISYQGGDIQLSENIVMKESQFPCLKEVIGKHLIVTDGTTLLGADDKAGVAEIMTAVATLISENIPHGELRIIFTTDEETGHGTDGLDVKDINCTWGYTVDGGALGLYEYENFNAASAKIVFHGVSIHTGDAKGVMKNAAAIACEFQCMLPEDEVPEKTEGYEGFYHLAGMQGDVTTATLGYIIRDHDRQKFEARKNVMEQTVQAINQKYGDIAELTMNDTYYNMAEKVLPHKHLLERIEKAFAEEGIPSKAEPIRGGTDGARLTWDGLPCPNLSTGGYNFHGVYEFIPQESLEAMPKVLVHLVKGFIE